MSVQIDNRQLEEIVKGLDRIQNQFSDKKTRRRIMRKPANIVKKAAQNEVKDSKRIHYRYSTPKIVKRRRAKKGSGIVVAAYYPGNLRKSIKRLLFRRSFREFVGPKIRRGSSKGVFGLNATKVDGYYAAMSRGRNSTADKFRKQVMEPGLRKSASRALQAAEEAVEKEIQKAKRQTGL